MLFRKKKKKRVSALKVVAIVVGVFAALAAGYVVFDRFIKGKLRCRRKCAEGEVAEAEEPEEAEEAEEAAEPEAAEEPEEAAEPEAEA